MYRLSIIIPAFNESPKIAHDIEAAGAFLAGTGIDGEIIVADDGSTDATADAARACSPPAGVPLTVIASPLHVGKGHAVRAGILASRGRTVLFADAGVTVPYADALTGLDLIESGTCSLAHGSRWLAESRIGRRQLLERRVLSRLVRVLVRLLFPEIRSLSDTQCGFKLYEGGLARELFAECQNPRFLFDVEIALRALRRGSRIIEFPVHWSCDRDSRLTVRSHSLEVLVDLFTLYRLSRSIAFRMSPAGPAQDPPPHR